MHKQTRLIGGVLAATLLTQLSACGTLLYPDRRGQIEGRVDPVVVALDAIGILFFVIPGLIAFGIDFATGAIYLPNGQYSMAPETLKQAVDAEGRVDNAKLKALIEQHTGHSLPLDDPRLIQHSANLEQLAAHGLTPAA
ncbi:polyribonucleotide nucleotidyltransferase [Pseudomonas benzenivorans]|uniref:Polyribonucleotide nucleotidyltransferase n=1 Tax=Pseudomonas benzenivorans TaxID=556533 RepID=A0ABY5H3L5_9PSED|nr:polyribonucleotide nucleotidyltransferase [Pseudomonas benzenivorans]UTW06599.1 polyribonucleotide nucleotidyltransferase [Pseudomonas benzenivorans]